FARFLQGLGNPPTSAIAAGQARISTTLRGQLSSGPDAQGHVRTSKWHRRQTRYARLAAKRPLIASSTTTSAAAPAVPAAALFTGARFVNGQITAIVFLFMQTADCFLCRIVIPHFDKTKALAAARFPILHDLCVLHFAELRKQLFQTLIGDIPAQIPDIQSF